MSVAFPAVAAVVFLVVVASVVVVFVLFYSSFCGSLCLASTSVDLFFSSTKHRALVFIAGAVVITVGVF